MLAIDPPESSTPSVVSGRPSNEASHWQTTISTVAGPDPPAHDAAMVWWPVPSHSPRTPAYDEGPGTRAK